MAPNRTTLFQHPLYPMHYYTSTLHCKTSWKTWLYSLCFLSSHSYSLIYCNLVFCHDSSRIAFTKITKVYVWINSVAIFSPLFTCFSSAFDTASHSYSFCGFYGSSHCWFTTYFSDSPLQSSLQVYLLIPVS